jgi:Tfp pilus assembly protein PilV
MERLSYFYSVSLLEVLMVTFILAVGLLGIVGDLSALL